jgi:hypothetical protein
MWTLIQEQRWLETTGISLFGSFVSDNLSTAVYHDAESSEALCQHATDPIRKTNRNSYAGSEHATQSLLKPHVVEKEVSKEVP